ncbi:hypothetical protein F2Q70_00031649 [Brassica cretica]|uniref:Uncharacterized protein n=1 Tax=Brassica cretica TaxID=69181 RepID=A0A8S9FNL4_BRACR|nr:hypothetical protein F2Q70_00031649 [Brassica cretica]
MSGSKNSVRKWKVLDHEDSDDVLFAFAPKRIACACSCPVVTSLACKHSRVRRCVTLSQAGVTCAVGFVAEPALWKRLATSKTQNVSPTRCFFNLSVWAETHCTLHASRDAIPASPALPLVPSLTFLQPRSNIDVN